MDQTPSYSPLLALGFWVESVADPVLPAPQDLVDLWEPALVSQTVDYLRRGHRVSPSRAHHWCRFQCGIPDHALDCSLTTDGTWLWPAHLAHYVEAHQVRLPEDFIAQVQNRSAPRGHLPPPPLSWDAGFWIQWCGRNSAGNAARRLQQARAIHSRRLVEIRQMPARALIARYKESADRCGMNGCSNRALHGTGFCAHCLSPMDQTAAERIALRGVLNGCPPTPEDMGGHTLDGTLEDVMLGAGQGAQEILPDSFTAIRVGWLADHVPRSGAVEEVLLEKLARLSEHAGIDDPPAPSAPCPLCGRHWPAGRAVLAANGRFWIFPKALLHYMADHRYLPPAPFLGDLVAVDGN